MTTNVAVPASKGFNTGVWVVQVLLALAFTGSALLKLTTPYDELGKQMAWVAHTSPMVVKLIGVAEALGVLGLILPSALRVAPVLTPVAAGGLVLTMLGAAATHLSIGEPQLTVPNVVLGGLAAFVAWARSSRVPIAPR